jgi:hypothetical protein
MAEAHSPLTVVLSELLERGFGVPSNNELLGLLELAVSDHGLEGDKAPEWMFEFFSRILNRRWAPRSERYEVPRGYPHGEDGLSNLLIDIDQEVHPLKLDDYGEALMWPIRGLSLHVSIIREWNGEGYGVVIKPLQT